MGKSSSTVVGYHYRIVYHAGLVGRSIDALLEYRGADKPAWVGELTASGRIEINAPQLFGGEKDQGGIVGPVDVMFGEADQLPNPYLQSVLGNQVVAWRGMTTLAFAGGRYGAMSPFAQKPSYKVRKIIKGWDDDDCWYPEKAVIGLGAGDTGELISAIAVTSVESFPSADGQAWSETLDSLPGSHVGYRGLLPLPDRYVTWSMPAGSLGYTFDGRTWHASTGDWTAAGGIHPGVYFKDKLLIAGGAGGLNYSEDDGMTSSVLAYPEYPASYHLAASPDWVISIGNGGPISFASDLPGPWTEGADCEVHMGAGGAMVYGDDEFLIGGGRSPPGQPKIVATDHGESISEETLPTFSSAEVVTQLAYHNGRAVAATDSGEFAYKFEGVWYLAADTLGAACIRLRVVLGKFVAISVLGAKESVDGNTWAPVEMADDVVDVASGLVVDTREYGLRAINPAHALYYNRIDKEKGAEPRANINNASLTDGANKLYEEGFGLCLEYDPAKDTPDSFDERICKVIGGSFERSLVDGQWYLSLARGDYDIDTLPILGDDDILDFRELPTTLDRAVNSLSVRYFDVERKETVITPAARALGLIRRFGEMHETLDMPEIANGELALIVAMRELRARVTPTRAFELVTAPESTRYWLRNSYFRLQSPKRRIGDMVCILGEKQHGTLRSGAVRVKAAQDIYSQDDTVYIEIETGVDTRPPQTPVAITLQRPFEAPYVELASALSNADLAALAPESGYLLTVASDPATSRDYTVRVAPAGAEYAEVGNCEWCPTAIVVEAPDFEETNFTLSGGLRLGEVIVGSPALWGDEIVRVDAIDPGAGTVVLGRGCADTVPFKHAAGTRIWFYDDTAAADTTAYTEGETVKVKLLTNTGSRQLPLGHAVPMTLLFDQRQSRPYAPGRVRVNTEVDPTALSETLTVEWAHRDRLLQADQLVDNEMESIGPEPTTRYALRFLDDVGDLIIEKLDISDLVTSATAVLDYTGDVTMELYSISDLGESWQRQRRTFAYEPPAGPVTSVIDAPTWTPVTVVIDGNDPA